VQTTLENYRGLVCALQHVGGIGLALRVAYLPLVPGGRAIPVIYALNFCAPRVNSDCSLRKLVTKTEDQAQGIKVKKTFVPLERLWPGHCQRAR
jgi:hypothetical protein